MNLRSMVAVGAARVASFGSRRLLRRGGTALPGLVAERIDPGLLARLGRELEGTVLVTGTNGKTTTARVLAAILRADGRHVIGNEEGSNLTRGMVSSLAAMATPGGRLKGGPAWGVFEADEASLPAAAVALRPPVMVFTNLFRDQLDRYGEVDTVAGFWRRAIGLAPADCGLVLNADDPSVAELALAAGERPVRWFGLDDMRAAAGERGAFDARWCAVCGTDFAYGHRFSGHIGHWRCPGCGRHRPQPETRALAVEADPAGMRLEVEGLGTVEAALAGRYNAWNILAAIAAGRELGVAAEALGTGPAAIAAVFGRQERVEVEGRWIRLFLVKNPAGANQVVDLLAASGGGSAFAFLLNDRFADGQDVSWTWDVDFERLAGRAGRAFAGGDRGADAALRLHYAGLEVAATLPPGPGEALDALVAAVEPGAGVDMMLTYTALVDLRGEMARRGLTRTTFG